jgi:hypothetical protein
LKPLRSFTLLLVSAASLNACATAPDPDIVCSPEWITPRLDVAAQRIEDRLDTALETLGDAGESWIRGRNPGPIQMFKLSQAAKRLEDEVKDGRGIQDLRLIARTCDDPDLIRDQIYALLERQNISGSLLAFLEGTGIMDQIVRTAEGDSAADLRS